MEMIEGLTPFVVIQSMAAICQERAPEPLSDKVFTARTVAWVATPKVVPAAVPGKDLDGWVNTLPAQSV